MSFCKDRRPENVFTGKRYFVSSVKRSILEDVAGIERSFTNTRKLIVVDPEYFLEVLQILK